MATRKELIIPLNTFIYRIAWFDANDMREAADTLRFLAAEFTPPYQVDEALVQAIAAELRRHIWPNCQSTERT